MDVVLSLVQQPPRGVPALAGGATQARPVDGDQPHADQPPQPAAPFGPVDQLTTPTILGPLC